MREILSIFLLVIPLAVAHVLNSQVPIKQNTLVKHSIDTRTNVTYSDYYTEEDKFFLSWLQNILGYRPPIASTTQPPISEQEKCPPCRCGITNKQNRIVGGIETQVNQYPWVALLMYRRRFYCGATVINSKYLLTAAHCITGFDRNLMSVRILEHDRNLTAEAITLDFRITEIIKHNGYSTVNYNNDIALIKIDGELNFDEKMRPACLAEPVKTFTGETGIVTGWGAIVEGGPVSTTLQEVSVPIMSNAECRRSKYPARKITDNMLCAGYKEGQKDSCQGDSGGPLHVVAVGLYRIIGIVSWGEGCAQPGYPGVYTRVNRYITWIMSNTADACYCSDESTLRLR
ncbi:PREDICTED: trypsin-1-like [Ceratosolen solmsi marchali]|uniref:Trypsin-1-like n=1 Tax=Ceratosolen solmsi marchali TaxID=326594 RepID=A0AAJ6YHI4_9HYME|nr:PREDICTED: trypsin-1-like [Ceratosolen solmsi marchali]